MSEDVRRLVGGDVRRLRTAAGLTQAELAAKMGCGSRLRQRIIAWWAQPDRCHFVALSAGARRQVCSPFSGGIASQEVGQVNKNGLLVLTPRLMCVRPAPRLLRASGSDRQQRRADHHRRNRESVRARSHGARGRVRQAPSSGCQTGGG